jgi:hypothetical protein
MSSDVPPEETLARTFTGLVVESLAVKQDFGAATIGCRGPHDAGDDALSSGDRVTVALSCYEDHSWEIQGVYCADHAVESVAETMEIRAERQAVVRAVLESTGYHPPSGDFEPDALTLGDVNVLDFSPTSAGYQ